MVSKDSGRELGKHRSRKAAVQQMRAVYANKKTENSLAQEELRLQEEVANAWSPTARASAAASRSRAAMRKAAKAGNVKKAKKHLKSYQKHEVKSLFLGFSKNEAGKAFELERASRKRVAARKAKG